MRSLPMMRTIGVVALLAPLTGPSFAQTNIGVPKPVCTTNIMCIINGVAYSPNTPIGYTCNNGYAAPVTTCHTPSTPGKLKPVGTPTKPVTPIKPVGTPIKGTNPVAAPISKNPIQAAPGGGTPSGSSGTVLEKGGSNSGGNGKH